LDLKLILRTCVVNIRQGDKYDVFIGRPTCWGNPFELGKDGTREEVIAKYQEWILSQPELVERVRKELQGKILGCYCSPSLMCHGDILVKIAEGEL
jgi:hypothetical protein